MRAGFFFESFNSRDFLHATGLNVHFVQMFLIVLRSVHIAKPQNPIVFVFIL
jgi:dTDP-4-dehydrorhamnose 3,5-epimerase-like enzyme